MCGNPAFDGGRPVPPPPPLPPPPPIHHHPPPDHGYGDSGIPPPPPHHHHPPPPAPPPPPTEPSLPPPPPPPAPPPFKPIAPQYEPSAPPATTNSTVPSISDTETEKQHASPGEWKGPAVVGWAYSIDDARKLARANNAGFAVYFCSELAAKTAGEGPKAVETYKLANQGTPPEATIFESAEVLTEFSNVGISTFVKIPLTLENLELAQSYGAETNTLVLCAPNGEKLWSCSGGNCNPTTVVQFLSRDFAARFSAWQKTQSGDAIALTPSRKTSGAIERLNNPALANALRFSAKLFCGGPPQGEAGFQALKSLGIKTIISVDGAAPETSRADALNMTYVHLPVPYRDIPHDRALEIAKAIRDLPGPVYIHCSNGTARAPAAAGVASVLLGEMSAHDAFEALKAAGTLPAYSGLYAATLKAEKVGKETLDALHVNFTARAEVSPLVSSMVAMEKVWKRIETAQSLDWNIPDSRSDLKPDEDMLQLIDCYMQAGKLEEIAKDPQKQTILSDGEKWCAVLRRTWKKDPQTPHRSEELTTAFKGVLSSCFDCHSKQ
jgi:protein tyrosine phosphatase (PTP) superfamily phosphohydrolase (DUF442 family)